jgi:IstB-like ATP binding protein
MVGRQGPRPAMVPPRSFRCVSRERRRKQDGSAEPRTVPGPLLSYLQTHRVRGPNHGARPARERRGRPESRPSRSRVPGTPEQLAYPRVLILDELGYLPLTREEASLFFRLLVRRYERASLIVTSNKSFVDWGEVFNGQILATAILDRLLHHATTVNIKGDSYQLREKKKAGLLGRKAKPAEVEEEVGAEA